MKRYKVIQWASGQVGVRGLRAVLDHPQLELVGVWCSGNDKEGKDAGELCGRNPIGVRATRNVDELLGLGADCVNYNTTDFGPEGRVKEVVGELSRILSAGTNVVGVATILGAPHYLDEQFGGQLRAACEEGRASLYGGGAHPDGSSAMVATLTSMSHRVDRVDLREQFDISVYDEPSVLSGFGLGVAPDAQGPAASAFDAWDKWPLYEHLWRGVTDLIAESFGETIDERRHQHTVHIAERGFDAPNYCIEAGTVGAVYHRMDCMIGGVNRISMHGYYWVGGYPQDWVQPFSPNAGYWINVRGIPDIDMGWHYSGLDLSCVDAECVATAARPVNAIPAVCEAAPGILTMYDLPHFGPRPTWRSS